MRLSVSEYDSMETSQVNRLQACRKGFREIETAKPQRRGAQVSLFVLVVGVRPSTRNEHDRSAAINEPDEVFSAAC
jgi:hypothetical protein